MSYYLDGRIIRENRSSKLIREVDIREVMFSKPSEGWESYLNRTFVEDGNWRTINGRLKLWKGTRLPLPWFTLFSGASLEEVYVFDKGFLIEPCRKSNVSRTSFGLEIFLPHLFEVRYNLIAEDGVEIRNTL